MQRQNLRPGLEAHAGGPAEWLQRVLRTYSSEGNLSSFLNTGGLLVVFFNSVFQLCSLWKFLSSLGNGLSVIFPIFFSVPLRVFYSEA